MEGLSPGLLILAVIVLAWLVFTAGAIFGYWLSGRLGHWADQNLHRDLYERDCEIAALKMRLRMLQPETDPRGLQEIRN